MALTERRIARFAVGRHKDGGGLYLNVTPTGRRSWILRASVEGRRIDRGLGSYPAVSLQEARLLAQETIFQIRVNGLAPSPSKSAKTVTFREATRRAHAAFKADWRPSYAAEWLRTMEKHAVAALGDILVSDVTQAQILDLLEPLYHSRATTGRVLRIGIRRVFAWCVARGLRPDNPASEVLDGGLPRKAPVPSHHAAPHYSEVAACLERVRNGHANLATRLVFETIAHTAARCAEARAMRWCDLNESWSVWTIPAEASKDGREHRKPITRQVRSILRAAKAIQGFNGRVSEYVFASPNGRPVGRSTLNTLRKRYGIRDTFTVHGLRTSFRSWGADRDLRWDALEMQLSHAVGNVVSRSYNRSDLLEDRGTIMTAWSDYLDPEDWWADTEARLLVPVGA